MNKINYRTILNESEELEHLTIFRNDVECIGLSEESKIHEIKFHRNTHYINSVKESRLKKIDITPREKVYNPKFDNKIPYNNNIIPYFFRKPPTYKQKRPFKRKSKPGIEYAYNLNNSQRDALDNTKKEVYWPLFNHIFEDKPYLPKLFSSEIERQIRYDKCFTKVIKHFQGSDYIPGLEKIHVQPKDPSDIFLEEVQNLWVGGPTFNRVANINIILRMLHTISEIYDEIITCNARTGMAPKTNNHFQSFPDILKTPIGIDTIIKRMPEELKAFLCKHIRHICHGNYYINKDPKPFPLNNADVIHLYQQIKFQVKIKELHPNNLEYLSNLKYIITKNANYLNRLNKCNSKHARLHTLTYQNLLKYYINHASNLPNMYTRTGTLTKEFISKIKNNPEDILNIIDQFECCRFNYQPALDEEKNLYKGTAIPIKIADKKRIKTLINKIINNHSPRSKKPLEEKIFNILLSDKVDITNECTIKKQMENYLNRVNLLDFPSNVRNHLFKQNRLPLLFINQGNKTCLINPHIIPTEILKLLPKINLQKSNKRQKIEHIKQLYEEYINWLFKPCDLKIINFYDLITNAFIVGVKSFKNTTDFINKHRARCKRREGKIYLGADSRWNQRQLEDQKEYLNKVSESIKFFRIKISDKILNWLNDNKLTINMRNVYKGILALMPEGGTGGIIECLKNIKREVFRVYSTSKIHVENLMESWVHIRC